MPHFYEDETETKKEAHIKDSSVKYPNLIVFLAFFFFVFSCGIESCFHSQSFTFGLCGPHSLTPNQVILHPPAPHLAGSLPEDHPQQFLPLWKVVWHLHFC